MNLRPLPENRIVRGAIDAELSWQPVDSDGDGAVAPTKPTNRAERRRLERAS